ncbi:MAG: hypothetical protein J5846_04395 [Desulfovibrio sp.]|nr:hypothetical protein [Desulfovibrio sp.]
MFTFAPRDAETSLPCPHCQRPLHIARSCHEVFMRCPSCEKCFPLKEFIPKADAAMEKFMENVYCDRV